MGYWLESSRSAEAAAASPIAERDASAEGMSTRSELTWDCCRDGVASITIFW